MALLEELHGEDRGETAEDVEVIPLDDVADCGGDDHASQFSGCNLRWRHGPPFVSSAPGSPSWVFVLSLVFGAPLRRVAAQHTGFPSYKEVSAARGRGRSGRRRVRRSSARSRPVRRRRHRRCLRATPDLTAASATAAATVGTTRASNIDGVMYSSLSSLFATIDASACAAASFIWSFTRLARTSSMPRKKPGKQHELLI